jgi:hypothetical protein
MAWTSNAAYEAALEAALINYFGKLQALLAAHSITVTTDTIVLGTIQLAIADVSKWSRGGV